MKEITHQTSRRDFVKTTLTAAAGAFVLPRFSIANPNVAKPPLRLAVIGMGNITQIHAKSWADTSTKRHIATLLCDPDKRRLDKDNPMITAPEINFPKVFPDAIRADDYRKVFDQYGDEFDAVLCGSTDHHHFGVSQLAMQHGKPIYCEKPLCWSPHEGLILQQTYQTAKVATQMGNQGNSTTPWKQAHAYYQNGHLGDIVEAHAWIRSSGSRGIKSLPTVADTIPSELNWKNYAGPGAQLPYKDKFYHPFNWRDWVEYGGGYIGDWGCHVFGGLFKTLDHLKYPSKVEIVKSSEFNGVHFPVSMTSKWTFPAQNGKPQFVMYFHTTYSNDPAYYPPRPETLEPEKPWPPSPHGCFWKGTKAEYVFNEGHCISGSLIPDSKRKEIGRIETIIPSAKGNIMLLHGDDWVDAIRGEKEWNDTVSNFGHGAHLSSIVQMANSALKAGHPISVNPETGYPTNPEDMKYFTRQNPNKDWYGMM